MNGADTSPRARQLPAATLHEPWLLLARAGWLAVALLIVIVLALLTSRGARPLLLEDSVSDSYAALSGWLSYQSYSRILLALRYLLLVVYLLTALFIFWRKSHEVIGLTISLLLLVLPLALNLGGLAPAFETTLATRVVNFLLGWSWLLGIIAVILVLFQFPNGRSVARWSTWGAWLLILAILGLSTLAVASDALSAPQRAALALPAGASFVGLLALGVISQVYRYLRISGPTERLQTRWVLAALVLVFVWMITVASLNPFHSYERWAGPWALFQLFGTVVVAALLPLALAQAIVSHHLWDIDVIIRKTLVYTLLTGFLAVVYLSSIVALQGLLTRLTGQDSTLATILSTLLIAALFLPARRRAQNLIDRRFYRRKYKATQVLERFAITVRDETDLDQLTAELMRVIQETMQPEHVSVWLRPTPDDRAQLPDDR